MANTRLRLIAPLLGIWVLGAIFGGCAPLPQPHLINGHRPFEAQTNSYWWGYRFKMAWPAGEEPDLAIDLFLAHAVVQPVLKAYENRIILWRFHRRAAPDASGHQFSLLFYSDPETAAEVCREIGQSRPLAEALAAGIVEKLIVDDPAHPIKPNLEDTSDPHWSPKLQQTWPVYIMGVSSLWLALIDESIQGIPEGPTDIQSLLARYREADTRVSSIWYKEGQHAFLHHLNAIFGYKPLLLRKEMSF